MEYFEAYFVVGEESGFAGVDSGGTSSAGRSVDDVIAWVAERERASVSGHADDEFVTGSTQSDPQIRGVVNWQLLPPFAVGWRSEERRVMTGLVLPFSVEIVSHEVDEIQVTGYGRHVVSAVDVVRTDRNSRS